MDGFEKLIKTIRSEANRDQNPYPIKLATMTAKDKCSYGGLPLDSDDLLVTEDLDGKLEKGDDVLITRVSSTKFAIIGKVVEM